MAGDLPVIEVRGSVVRCSGSADKPHRGRMIELPPDKVVTCPKCGRRFQRASWWNVLSSAIWPDQTRR